MNKKKISGVLSFLLFCFAFCVLFVPQFAESGVIFQDDFDYTGSPFTANGWTYSNGACGAGSEPNHPINGTFSGGAWGINTSVSGCAFSYTRKISRTLPNNITSGTMSIEYDFEVYNTSNPLQTPFIVSIGNTTSNLDFSFYQSYTGTLAYKSIFVDAGNGANCTLAQGYSQNDTRGHLYLYVDMSTKKYSVFVNGSAAGCENVAFSTGMTRINAMSLSQQVAASAMARLYVDNLVISLDAEIVSGLLPLYAPCNSDAECATGKCDYGTCIQKSGGYSCVSNIECISGSCVNGICKNAGIADQLNAVKDETFGEGTLNSSIAAILITVLVTVLIVMSGRNFIAVILALVVFVVLIFVFTLIGWLSPFIVIGLIVALALGAIVFWLFKGNS